MTDNDLIRCACETAAAYLALGNECFVANGGTFVRNRETPNRYDSNHVGAIGISTPPEIDALLSRADLEFGGYEYRRFDTDPLTPPEFVARLVLEGYTAWGNTIWLVLEGDLPANPRGVEIREVLTEEDWAAYRHLAELDRQEDYAKHDRTYDESSLINFFSAKRLKHPPVRSWLASEDGEARAYFSSWPGENGVGMVEDLFTQLEYRHRGIATALIAHCVADARARGAGPVIIGADPADTPKQMYANLGFRPLYTSHNYVKILEPTS